jgi:hypothetical protein
MQASNWDVASETTHGMAVFSVLSPAYMGTTGDARLQRRLVNTLLLTTYLGPDGQTQAHRASLKPR